MYAPTSPLPVATAAGATRVASSRGVVASADGVRTGATRRRLNKSTSGRALGTRGRGRSEPEISARKQAGSKARGVLLNRLRAGSRALSIGRSPFRSWSRTRVARESQASPKRQEPHRRGSNPTPAARWAKMLLPASVRRARVSDFGSPPSGRRGHRFYSRDTGFPWNLRVCCGNHGLRTSPTKGGHREHESR
jgi:hypothetical protein